MVTDRFQHTNLKPALLAEYLLSCHISFFEMYRNQGQEYKANILVVDDTPDNLRLLSAMLTTQALYIFLRALTDSTKPEFPSLAIL